MREPFAHDEAFVLRADIHYHSLMRVGALKLPIICLCNRIAISLSLQGTYVLKSG